MVSLAPNVLKHLIIEFSIILRQSIHHFYIFHYFPPVDSAFCNLQSFSKSLLESSFLCTVVLQFYLPFFFLSWHLWTLMRDITICLAARYWLQTPSVLSMLLGKLEPLHLGARCCVSLKSAGILLPESASSSCQSQQLSLQPGAANVCCATGRIYLRGLATAHKPSILLRRQRYASHLSAGIWAFAPYT